ncbi:MAG: hypothetical protein M3065_09645 [Actinomycetota bacterium]|nr:hypothetical protein [Actinomycetota bacterium]
MEGDAEELPFGDHEFDRVLSFRVDGHLAIDVGYLLNLAQA